ncbi:MAG TPA: hypothetical protein VFH22_06255 [Rhodocyclaceae bacterium]|nr:hypothetical protein [Rhodocyclaceae bacterium]
MQDDPIQQKTRPKQAGYSGVHVIAPGGFLSKLLGLVGAAVALILIFAFSLVLLVVVALAAILIWGYLKYRARALRRAEARGDFDFGGGRGARRHDHGEGPHQRADDGGPAGGLIIEGEVVREDAPAGQSRKPR